MRYILLFLTLFSITQAKIHYAKVEALQTYSIKSDISGKVIYSATNLEGKFVKDAVIIKLDTSDDRARLLNLKTTLELERENISLMQELLPELKENFKRQRDYFKRLKDTQSTSQAQKDSAYSAMVNAKNLYISTRANIIASKERLSKYISDIDILEHTISKKSITLHNRYLYALRVKEGDYISPGREIMVSKDLSRAKLIIYLDRDELRDLKSKNIYINGKLDKSAKISKVWQVADEKYISEYRVEIIKDADIPFSSLAKVELK